MAINEQLEQGTTDFRVRENEAAEKPAQDAAIAETFKKYSPEVGTQKHPELASAYAAVAAIGKKVEADGLTPEQSALVLARVRKNMVRSIERGELPEVKRREQVTVRIHVKTEAKEERELGR
jgi:hypothetical protein